ncbi:MAG: glycosyltransferase family 2 protein [Candidatus Omnitrophica bacterium]|nr:glycosyltransferase family 2 protein [Candidatus Omnitrophota bacterium]MCB9721533.1 glycosyltransferase family 2 protein [Candidatus Omnitrophota bacterium]
MTKPSSQHTISVIIPVFNEEASLPKVIADLPKHLLREIIVVDNASTDGSAAVAAKLGCRVIREDRRGYGQACLTGIAALDPAADIVVFVDGDYSDHPDQLPRLIQPILSGSQDFVIGSRALGNRERGAMTPQAYYGNRLACFLMKIFWGAVYTDLGPFRAITRRALEQVGMTDRDFGWTIEMQIRAVEEGVRTTEVPVDYRRRTGVSKISGTVAGTILAGHKILHTIFKYKFFRHPGRGPVASVADRAC